VQIKIKDLHFQQGDFSLNCDELQIPHGKMVALLGPSGSGKSTLLRLLAGFHSLQQGRIFLGEKEISHLPPYKRDLGFLFQDLALFPHMSAGENIRFGLKMKQYSPKQQDKVLAEMLEMVDLEGFESRRCQELSGGERQRVALARALAPQPECLLLDEPLSALDAAVRKRLGREIRRIQQQRNLTTLLVTHDQQEALNLADWIVLIKEGRIIESGTPQDLYNHPRDEWTASFLGEGIVLEVVSQDEKHITTALGTFPWHEDRLVQKILIRPEWLCIKENGIAGKVLRCDFGHGAYEVEIEVKGMVLHIRSTEYFNPGEELGLSWNRFHPLM